MLCGTFFGIHTTSANTTCAGLFQWLDAPGASVMLTLQSAGLYRQTVSEEGVNFESPQCHSFYSVGIVGSRVQPAAAWRQRRQ